MNFLERSRKRFSVRKFTNQQIEKAKIELILTAAQAAPTAHNDQPQLIFVMQSPEALLQVDSFTKGRFNAPTVFVLCYDKKVSWKRKDGYDSGEVDCGIIGTHIMFEALELGLGSCWVAMFHEDLLKETMGLGENIMPIALIPVGYPAEDAKPFQFHFVRKPRSETVEFR